jgi:c-di-GMP-binding flagellar brake protein YcgR
VRDDIADFVISRQAEITALLARLCDSCTPIVLAAPGGASLTVRLWSADAAGRRLRFGTEAHTPQLPSAIAADEVVAIAYLDNIQLQFSLHGLVLVHGSDETALQTGWPETVLRLQRRDSYRVRMHEPLAPSVSFRHPSMPDMALSLRLLDLSNGGCALLLPANVPELQPGSSIHGISVELDALTRFEGKLLLHHVSALDGEQGPRRIGCSWIDLSPAAERALQRYIQQTQKRQRLRPFAS